VIKFLWSDGVKSSNIYGRMTGQYGGNSMNQRKFYELVDRGRLGDWCWSGARSGWPVTVMCAEVEHIDWHTGDSSGETASTSLHSCGGIRKLV